MRRETIVGIAIEILGNGIGVGLQITGFIEPILGWIIIAISSASGLLLIGYGIGKGNNGSEQPEVNQSLSRLDIKKQDGSIESVTKGDLAFLGVLMITMESDHGHPDIEGLIADRASGVPLNELKTRNCSRCGVLRNKRGRDIYVDE